VAGTEVPRAGPKSRAWRLDIFEAPGAPLVECAGRARESGPSRRRRFGSERPNDLWITNSSWRLKSKAVSRGGLLTPLATAVHNRSQCHLDNSQTPGDRPFATTQFVIVDRDDTVPNLRLLPSGPGIRRCSNCPRWPCQLLPFDLPGCRALY